MVGVRLAGGRVGVVVGVVTGRVGVGVGAGRVGVAGDGVAVRVAADRVAVGFGTGVGGGRVIGEGGALGGGLVAVGGSGGEVVGVGDAVGGAVAVVGGSGVAVCTAVGVGRIDPPPRGVPVGRVAVTAVAVGGRGRSGVMKTVATTTTRLPTVTARPAAITAITIRPSSTPCLPWQFLDGSPPAPLALDASPIRRAKDG